MGRHVAADLPDLDRLVEDACAAIGRDIEALEVPRLMGVVLGGGYGRGEGGAKEKLERTALSNDLDFFAVADEGAPEAETISAIGAALEPVAKKWTEKLGVDVDFAVKTRWRLKHDEERIMVQELLRGYFDVAGEKGERLFAGIELRPAESIPWMEAARLMMNRGMGLLFAKRRIESAECRIDGSSAVGRRLSDEQRDFVNRNINKCVLGAGDARLITRRAYAWRARRASSPTRRSGNLRHCPAESTHSKASSRRFARRVRTEPSTGLSLTAQRRLATASTMRRQDGSSVRRTSPSAAGRRLAKLGLPRLTRC